MYESTLASEAFNLITSVYCLYTHPLQPIHHTELIPTPFPHTLKNPSINHLNFYCIKQRDYTFSCVCTVIDHRRYHSMYRTTAVTYATQLCLIVSYFLFFTRCNIFCDLLQYTHRKCNLFVRVQNSHHKQSSNIQLFIKYEQLFLPRQSTTSNIFN